MSAGLRRGVFGGLCFREGCENTSRWIPVEVPSIDPNYQSCYYCAPCCEALASGKLTHKPREQSS